MLTPCTPQHHVTEVLKDLHWLPVKKRVIFKILLLTYKCVNLSPKYLCELLLGNALIRYEMILYNCWSHRKQDLKVMGTGHLLMVLF